MLNFPAMLFRKLHNFPKSINTKEIKVKKKRELWITAEITQILDLDTIFQSV